MCHALLQDLNFFRLLLRIDEELAGALRAGGCAPSTVRKYMPKRPPGQPRGDQRWSTFLKNHAKAVLACDFFVVVTAKWAKVVRISGAKAD